MSLYFLFGLLTSRSLYASDVGWFFSIFGKGKLFTQCLAAFKLLSLTFIIFFFEHHSRTDHNIERASMSLKFGINFNKTSLMYNAPTLL